MKENVDPPMPTHTSVVPDYVTLSDPPIGQAVTDTPGPSLSNHDMVVEDVGQLLKALNAECQIEVWNKQPADDKKAAPTDALAEQAMVMGDDAPGPLPDHDEMAEDVGSSSHILNTEHQMTGWQRWPAQDTVVGHSRKKWFM